jgi:hypothetical protein
VEKIAADMESMMQKTPVGVGASLAFLSELFPLVYTLAKVELLKESFIVNCLYFVISQRLHCLLGSVTIFLQKLPLPNLSVFFLLQIE